MFDQIFVQPAAGDAGGALGAAYAAHASLTGTPKPAPASRDHMAGSYLGPAYNDDDIGSRLEKCGAKLTRLNDNDLLEKNGGSP